jgi:hypothetical protein
VVDPGSDACRCAPEAKDKHLQPAASRKLKVLEDRDGQLSLATSAHVLHSKAYELRDG